MDKRGDVSTEMPLEMEKTVLYVIIFLILASVFYGVYGLLTKEKVTAAQQDMERVARDLATLNTGERDETITLAEGYQLFLYGAGNEVPLCAGNPCLCVEQPGEKTRCKVLSGVRGDCAKDVCVPAAAEPQRFPESGVLQKGTAVSICRRDNALKLGTC